ncbi:Lig chan domain containing protein, partial [Asbolus verrucosus]
TASGAPVITSFENYIIVAFDISDLTPSLTRLEDNFNTRAKVLVIFQNNSTEDGVRYAFETLWDLYIYNVVIFNWTDFSWDDRLSFILRLNQPKLLINPTVPRELTEFQNYIIVANEISNLEALRYKMNTRGRFLGILPNSTEDELKSAFETLLSFNIYNVVIYNWTDFVTWYPYNSENRCGTSVNLVTNSKSLNSFANKIPKKFNGCSLSVTWWGLSISIKTPFNESDPGFIIDFLNAVGKKIDVKLVYLKENLNYFALVRAKRHYEDLREDMLRRKIDVCVNIMDIEVGDSIGAEMENSKYLFEMFNYFILPPRRKIMDSGKIFGFFSLGIWSMITVSVLVMAILWCVLTKSSLKESVFQMIRLTLQLAMDQEPKATFQRLVFLLFFFYIMNLSWIYTSKMSSVLTLPSYEKKIKTITELSQSEKTLRFHEIFEINLKVKGEEIYENIMKKTTMRVDKGNFLKELKDFVKVLNYGTIVPDTVLYFVRKPNNLEVITQEQVSTLQFVLNIRKGLPLLEKIDEAILHIRESGLIFRWIQKSSINLTKINLTDYEEIEDVPLNLEHIFCPLLILFLQFILQSNQPKILANPTISQSLVPHQNYIMVGNNLNTSLQELKYKLNTRANFLVTIPNDSTDDDLKSVFETFWHHYIYNVVIFTNRTDFVTWYPFHTKNKCGNFVNLVTNPKSPNVFENKLPKNFRNCPLLVTWVALSPGVKNPFDESDPGYIVEFIDAIAKKTNTDLTFMTDNLDYMNIGLSTNNMNHLIRDMIERKIDASITVSSVASQFVGTELETTFPMFEMDCYFVLPPRRRIRNGTKIFEIFSSTVWSIILASLLMMAIFWKILTKSSLEMSSFHMVRLMLQFMMIRMPTKTMQRLVIILYFFYIMNLDWIYVSKLSSVLTEPSFEPKIRTIAELSESDKPLEFYEHFMKYLSAKDKRIIDGLMKKRRSNAEKMLINDRMKNFVAKLEYGIITGEHDILAFIKNPNKLEILSKEKVSTVHWHLNVKKGFPLLGKINEAILHIRESGLAHKWVYDSIKNTEKTWVPDYEGQDKVSLGLEHIFCSLVLLSLGLVTSVFVFIFEILLTNFN